MPAPKTGPCGYPSNIAAILDLMRFGFGIWTPTRMAVLLYHVERSTAYGWASDQHSQSQAMGGIYAQERRRWIRGPAGPSQAQWHRENAALIKDGLIQKLQRRTARNGHAATEFRPDWLAIRAAIQAWQVAAQPEDKAPLFQAPFSHPERRESLTAADPFSHPERRASLTATDTVVSSCSLTEVSESRAEAAAPDSLTFPAQNHHPKNPSAQRIADAVERAYGAALLPSDAIPGQLLAITQRLGLPIAATCRWIQEFATNKRAERYTITSPRLFVTAAARDLIPWANSHRPIIDTWLREETMADPDRNAQAHAPVEMPAKASPATSCPNCQEEELQSDGTCTSHQCLQARLKTLAEGKRARSR